FEIALTPLQFRAVAPTDEEIASGAAPEIRMLIFAGIYLPIAQPGTNQPLAVPAATISFAMSKDDAAEIGAKLQAEAARLPSKAKIEVASSLAGVDHAAKLDAKFRGER